MPVLWLESAEGTRLNVTSAGVKLTNHVGSMARGETSQDLHLERSVAATDDGYELRIRVTNDGVDEIGIPGVRVVSLQGLITETDGFGRYHVAGIDVSRFERGRNFYLKVDSSTLPEGSEFTTENPRIKRITQGLMNRFNFGVRLPKAPAPRQAVTVQLGEVFFDESSDEIRAEHRHLLEQMADEIVSHDASVIRIDSYAGSCPTTARKAEAYRFTPRFPVLGAQLGEADRRYLDLIAAEWKGYADIKATVVGYTSSVPIAARNRHIFADNYALSQARAAAVAEYLVERLGITLDYVAVLGLGPEDPVASNDTAEGRALNRRVELDIRGRNPGEVCIDADYDAAELARRRGERVSEALMSLLDEEQLAKVEIASAASATNGESAEESARPQSDGAEGRDASGAGRRTVDLNTTKRSSSGPDAGQDNCSIRECRRGGSLVIKTLGQPVAGVPEEKQDNRRAVVDGRFSMHLPEGGVIWATEDAAILDPRLAVRAPGAVNLVGGRPVEPIVFSAYTNYAAYMQSMELHVYREADIDRVEPLVILRSDPRSLATFVWEQPTFPSGDRELTYVLYAIGEGGQRDETEPQSLSLTEGLSPLDRVGRRASDDSQGAEEETPLVASATAVYGQTNLARQNIPIAGSRVRLFGQAIGGGHRLAINGDQLPVDTRDKFAVEYFLPIGKHEFAIELTDASGNAQHYALEIDVTGRYMFIAALADITASGNDISGSVEPLSGDDSFDEDFLLEGRLAVYLKGKIKGRYLVTAQLDTREEELEDILDNIHRKDPQSVFRRLDPDRYYPVYGDDSTTISDTDTQGRMYVRVDWDKSQLLWGNFNTDVTGTEFAQYNRSLYGARAKYRSVETTELGDAKTQVQAFASEAQTSLGHSEFLGTGGSLYYLRHTDILPDSDKARIEVRDRDSGRVLENIILTRGTDYEIDELQGRIILARPLLQITRQFSPSLIRNGQLDGDDMVLLVDYEYIPPSFDADNMTAGGRAKQWLGENLAVGATHVEEGRAGDDYRMSGADVTLQAGRGTFVKAEYAQSEATQAARFFSTDGGLSFQTLNPGDGAERAGNAYGVEARMNLREQGLSEGEWTGAVWWRRTDDNFSSARRDFGVDTKEYGAEFSGELTDLLRLTGRATVQDREAEMREARYGLLADYRISQAGTVSGELQRVRTELPTRADMTDALVAALRYTYTLSPGLEVHGTVQETLEDDNGAYANNDLVSVGSRWLVTDRTSLIADLSTGDRSDAATLSLDHRWKDAYNVYGTFTHSNDNTEGTFADQFTVGSRARISNLATVWGENQVAESSEQSTIGHVFGLDLAPAPGWTVGVSLQRGELETLEGTVERDASSVSGGFNGEKLRWLSRIEYREDNGARQTEQWVTTNRLDYKFREDLRLLSKLNYSDSDDAVDYLNDARFIEASVGFGYRPVWNDRLNLLGKYTYLYDLSSFAQEGGTGVDQKSRVVSLEGIYDLGKRWSLGGKIAQRHGELREGRGMHRRLV